MPKPKRKPVAPPDRIFVVGRDAEGAFREFFAGVVECSQIATTGLIFEAYTFASRAEAEEAVAFLARHDLTGFAPSEILDSGSTIAASDAAAAALSDDDAA